METTRNTFTSQRMTNGMKVEKTTFVTITKEPNTQGECLTSNPLRAQWRRI